MRGWLSKSDDGWTGTFLRLVLFGFYMMAYMLLAIPSASFLESLMHYVLIWSISELTYRIVARNFIQRGKRYAI